jgi:hypothetical protein
MIAVFVLGAWVLGLAFFLVLLKGHQASGGGDER